jgi:hypothetical protein
MTSKRLIVLKKINPSPKINRESLIGKICFVMENLEKVKKMNTPTPAAEE